MESSELLPTRLLFPDSEYFGIKSQIETFPRFPLMLFLKVLFLLLWISSVFATVVFMDDFC